MKKKTGRNDPCPCGSGKKFKKCCEKVMIAGKYKAAKVEEKSATQIQKAAGLTSFFQSTLKATPKKPTPSEDENPSSLIDKVTEKKTENSDFKENSSPEK